MSVPAGGVTQLIRRWKEGDSEAGSALFNELLPELHRIATYCFRGERSGHTLQPTALVNEAFLRLAMVKGVDWQDRGHFLAVASRVMRRYLIDYARSRPEVQFVPIEGLPTSAAENRTTLELAVAIDGLLDELEAVSRQQRAVVELKFFLGLTDSEAADALGLSLHTLQREWYRARKWLFERLSRPACPTLRNTING
jgi:RNA polymerase sigma factor (TIGR02999 family)